MTLLGIMLLGLALVGFASSALDDSSDRAPQSDSGTLDALLFMLCLVGVLHASAKRRDDEDLE